MASIVAHELEEATTDPDGSKYNVVFGGTQYLIQRNWVNASGGYCSMSY